MAQRPPQGQRGTMLNQPEPACLLIADISGYTDYLAGVELDHAQDILADLVGTVVDGLRPTFRLAKLEGDAAFAYALTDRIDSSLLQDTVESTYFAFRRRLRDIGQASRCECNACILMPRLDLKFVVHHGLVVRQRVAGWDELVGRDVILVHRLLKNAVEAETGIRAYALYTDAAVRAMDADPGGQGLREHREMIDIIGEVIGWVRDLDAAWAAERDRTRVIVPADEAYAVIAYEVATPPQLTWEYVTSPIRRPQWIPGIERVDEVTQDGRRGVGTTNHCIHGKDAIVEEVVDWRPPEYQTVWAAVPDPSLPRVLMSDVLTPLPTGGTRVEVRIGRPAPEDLESFRRLFEFVEASVKAGASALTGLLAGEADRLAAQAATTPEPPLPHADRSFLERPVTGATTAVDTAGARSSSS